MLTPFRANIHQKQQSIWRPGWFPDVAVTGIQSMPVLGPCDLGDEQYSLTSFLRMKRDVDMSSMVVHGYAYDSRLRSLYTNPARYLSKFSQFAAVIAPDFSMYRSMPQHERVKSSWASKSVAAYYQTHGLKVVPNVRWSEIADLDFVLEGLPSDSTISVSTQSITRDPQSFKVLREGIPTVIGSLRPKRLIVYGPLPTLLQDEIGTQTRLLHYATDCACVHTKKAA